MAQPSIEITPDETSHVISGERVSGGLITIDLIEFLPEKGSKINVIPFEEINYTFHTASGDVHYSESTIGQEENVVIHEKLLAAHRAFMWVYGSRRTEQGSSDQREKKLGSEGREGWSEFAQCPNGHGEPISHQQYFGRELHPEDDLEYRFKHEPKLHCPECEAEAVLVFPLTKFLQDLERLKEKGGHFVIGLDPRDGHVVGFASGLELSSPQELYARHAADFTGHPELEARYYRLMKPIMASLAENNGILVHIDELGLVDRGMRYMQAIVRDTIVRIAGTEDPNEIKGFAPFWTSKFSNLFRLLHVNGAEEFLGVVDLLQNNNHRVICGVDLNKLFIAMSMSEFSLATHVFRMRRNRA